MKVITNILLVAALAVYVLMPLFVVQLTGSVTGLDYTADALTQADTLGKKLFALLPFISGFGAIAFNCLKHRYWSFVSAAFVALGISFYILAHGYMLVQEPGVLHYGGIGVGFSIAYCLMILAMASAVISLLPFRFNMLHELDRLQHLHLPHSKPRH